ncbi:CarD-like transcriptional regulator [Labilithrix luteola]|uniref:CarD-like transcriptional regulator n=1 Tax=Labilithrix luteola TaxID=1391654 RepID=A0A0K1Q3H3_9BACT|nr:CarD family transcriptional regulator [Labilithrix luteola]AKU99919.1 CarD-like transcriptional regulator [Labilithrix luteola]
MAQSTARTPRSSGTSSLARASSSSAPAAKPRKTPARPAATPKVTKPKPSSPSLRTVARPASKTTKSSSKTAAAKPEAAKAEAKNGAVTKAAAPAAATTPPAPEKVVTTVVAKGYVPLVNIPKPPPPPSNFQLAVGDKAVHPSHGLAEVTAIEHREIGSVKGEFYILRILDNGMRVMVPRMSGGTAGIRPVMSAKEADLVLDTMRAREVAVDLQPWSRRFRAYTEMIKSGAPHEVAKVLRDMYRLKFDKDLSFGERRLLDQAKSLLMKELAAAKAMTEAELQAKVDDMFRA